MKLSKLLYSVVNEILPVPEQVLKEAYQKYDQFIQSDQKSKITFKINYNNKQIIITYNIGYSSRVFFKINKQDELQILIICNKTIKDKDIIQHQLKHCIEYWKENQNNDKMTKFYNLQFKTYITDFCNLFTQIYKRLNRRFNVSLETIIEKLVINVIDNKTNINKYKNLFNSATEFLEYQKTIVILQLYKYGKSNINIQLLQYLEKDYNLSDFIDINKYNQFFNIIYKHIKTNVKKINSYDIKDLIQNKKFKQLDLCIQKRLIKQKDINIIINKYIDNDQYQYLTNLIII